MREGTAVGEKIAKLPRCRLGSREASRHGSPCRASVGEHRGRQHPRGDEAEGEPLETTPGGPSERPVVRAGDGRLLPAGRPGNSSGQGCCRPHSQRLGWNGPPGATAWRPPLPSPRRVTSAWFRVCTRLGGQCRHGFPGRTRRNLSPGSFCLAASPSFSGRKAGTWASASDVRALVACCR